VTWCLAGYRVNALRFANGTSKLVFVAFRVCQCVVFTSPTKYDLFSGLWRCWRGAHSIAHCSLSGQIYARYKSERQRCEFLLLWSSSVVLSFEEYSSEIGCVYVRVFPVFIFSAT